MYQVKNQIYLDMTKNQKSALCNFLRALVKKSPELSVNDILDKFLEDERYYFEINNPHFEFLENYLDDETFLKDTMLFLKECRKYYDYKKKQEPIIQAQKEYEKKKPMIQAEKQSRDIKKVKTNSKKSVKFKTHEKNKYVIGCILLAGLALLMALRAGTISFEDKNNSPFMCLLKIFTKDDFTISNPNMQITSVVFFIMLGIEALVVLFVFLDKAQKKASRVGHEHGMARLGNKADLKKYRNKFMENTDNIIRV